MPKLQLNLDSLGSLDAGRARAIIDTAIRKAVEDTEDRGSDGKPRRVDISLTFNARGDRIAVDVQAGVTLPKMRTAETLGKVQSSGRGALGLFFQEDAPENPDQETIPFGEAKA